MLIILVLLVERGRGLWVQPRRDQRPEREASDACQRSSQAPSYRGGDELELLQQRRLLHHRPGRGELDQEQQVQLPGAAWLH